MWWLGKDKEVLNMNNHGGNDWAFQLKPWFPANQSSMSSICRATKWHGHGKAFPWHSMAFPWPHLPRDFSSFRINSKSSSFRPRWYAWGVLQCASDLQDVSLFDAKATMRLLQSVTHKHMQIWSKCTEKQETRNSVQSEGKHIKKCRAVLCLRKPNTRLVKHLKTLDRSSVLANGA